MAKYLRNRLFSVRVAQSRKEHPRRTPTHRNKTRSPRHCNIHFRGTWHATGSC